MGIRKVTSSAPFLTMMIEGFKKILEGASDSNKCTSILNRMSVQLEGKLGSSLRIETKGHERLLIVRAVDGSNYSGVVLGSQKDVVEAHFACCSPQVLTKHAVLSIGSFELAPGSAIFAKLDFRKMDVLLVRSELNGVPDPGQSKALTLRALHPLCTLPCFLMCI